MLFSWYYHCRLLSSSPSTSSDPHSLLVSTTLHPAPCTLHPVPCTLHPAPCTLYPGLPPGTVPENHPLAHGVLGVFGNAGTESGAEILAQADCVLSFCVVDHTQMLTNKEGLQARRLIIFHENTMYADWRFTPAASVIGHLEASTRAVARRVTEMKGSAPATASTLPLPMCESCPRKYKVATSEQGTAGYCHPGVFLNALSVRLSPKAVVCVDVGDVTLWAAMAMCLTQPGQRVLSSEHMGIMG